MGAQKHFFGVPELYRNYPLSSSSTQFTRAVSYQRHVANKRPRHAASCTRPDGMKSTPATQTVGWHTPFREVQNLLMQDNQSSFLLQRAQPVEQTVALPVSCNARTSQRGLIAAIINSREHAHQTDPVRPALFPSIPGL